MEADARTKVHQLFAHLRSQGPAPYLGEPISQLQHSLQAAHLASTSSSPEETIIAALLHDIGRFIPAAASQPRMIAPDGTFIGTEAHEVVGERYLREMGFGEGVWQVVGAHVWAKRYLCAVEGGYWEGLSKSSKESLEFQGGRFTAAQVEDARRDPLLGRKLAVRRWDDRAKVPGLEVPGLGAYEEMAVRCLLLGKQAV